MQEGDVVSASMRSAHLPHAWLLPLRCELVYEIERLTRIVSFFR